MQAIANIRQKSERKLIVSIICPRCGTPLELETQRDETNNPELHQDFGEYIIQRHKGLDCKECPCGDKIINIGDTLIEKGIPEKKLGNRKIKTTFGSVVEIGKTLYYGIFHATDNRRSQEV